MILQPLPLALGCRKLSLLRGLGGKSYSSKVCRVPEEPFQEASHPHECPSGCLGLLDAVFGTHRGESREFSGKIVFFRGLKWALEVIEKTKFT